MLNFESIFEKSVDFESIFDNFVISKKMSMVEEVTISATFQIASESILARTDVDLCITKKSHLWQAFFSK